ncbi:MAG: glutamine-hydrolyzing carbamoyl-phosphate synthase small subunit [Candidatus Desulfofervidus auxilii]|nr:glutamine-hydrolyzing carbamoyl-phosphate synthase small subunit [Candidatus Desulfofervidus auxilii]
MKAILVLEDGTTFYGNSFTGEGEVVGEVVFNTGMTGYQEILTDPSYKGQIVTMTYPLIGNYGINEEDIESNRIHVEGFIVKEYCPFPSNWRSKKTLADYLKEAGVLGIEGIDTRALTRHIRLQGAMNGIISTKDFDIESLSNKLKAFPGLIGRDLATPVSCKHPFLWQGGKKVKVKYLSPSVWQDSKRPYKVVAIDCGIKFNILRELEKRGCEMLVVPAKVTAKEILETKPDGIFLSNGPGDPAAVVHVIKQVKELIGKKPIFGICLGHQILGLALGGKTFKLKFGHRGINHPVKNLATGRVEITSQNHGFCVDIDSLTGKGMEITHINLNDNTLEGMRHRYLPLFSVQYHPEASPGPHDASYLFDEFIQMMK